MHEKFRYRKNIVVKLWIFAMTKLLQKIILHGSRWGRTRLKEGSNDSPSGSVEVVDGATDMVHGTPKTRLSFWVCSGRKNIPVSFEPES